MQCVCVYDSRSIQAEEFAEQIHQLYGWEVFDSKTFVLPKHSEDSIFITLGGDGLLLHVTRILSAASNFPRVYPINYGTIGFLTNNRTQAVNLEKKIKTAVPSLLKFLKVDLNFTNAEKSTQYALNDVSILRQSGQATYMKISINGITRIAELVADGIVISTPAGSTAYNFSVGGPIFGLSSGLLGVHPVSPFRPRYWRGALLSDQSTIEVEMLQIYKRPASVNVDSKHFHDIEKIKVRLCKDRGVELLFDKQFTMEDKILSEQFSI